METDLNDVSKTGIVPRPRHLPFVPWIVAAAACAAAFPAWSSEAPPLAAQKAGYSKVTYAVDHFDQNNVDMAETYKPDFKLYRYNPYFSKTSLSRVQLNADGTLTTSGNNAGVWTIGCVDAGCSRYVGFSFGGGAYVEAEVAYDALKIDTANGWPAVWMLSAESMTRTAHWPGQPDGYNHTAEIDILEHQYADKSTYGGTIHDQFGLYDVTCKGRPACFVTSPDNVKRPPAGTDWRKFHKAALLWIPATNAHKGSVQFFYDDQPVGPPSKWDLYSDTFKPPVTDLTPWRWGVLDKLHMVLIIGAGSSAPITVRSIHVWQAN